MPKHVGKANKMRKLTIFTLTLLLSSAVWAQFTASFTVSRPKDYNSDAAFYNQISATGISYNTEANTTAISVSNAGLVVGDIIAVLQTGITNLPLFQRVTHIDVDSGSEGESEEVTTYNKAIRPATGTFESGIIRLLHSYKINDSLNLAVKRIRFNFQSDSPNVPSGLGPYIPLSSGIMIGYTNLINFKILATIHQYSDFYTQNLGHVRLHDDSATGACNVIVDCDLDTPINIPKGYYIVIMSFDDISNFTSITATVMGEFHQP